MSQVFVGNPTLLHREFHYRIPETKTLRVLRIPAGGQARMPEDLEGDALNSVIEQLERFGGVPQDDIRAIVMPKAFVYRVAPSPIKADVLEEGLERDEMARQELSGDKLEAAGFSAFQNAQTTAPNGKKVVETSIEIVEVNDRGRVKDGVNAEFVVSAKPGRRAGRKRTEDKN